MLLAERQLLQLVGFYTAAIFVRIANSFIFATIRLDIPLLVAVPSRDVVPEQCWQGFDRASGRAKGSCHAGPMSTLQRARCWGFGEMGAARNCPGL